MVHSQKHGQRLIKELARSHKLTSPNPQPFIIGCVATDAELAANFMEWTTADNLGYFKGAIDELKIYNIALTDGQVSKLYNDEKP